MMMTLYCVPSIPRAGSRGGGLANEGFLGPAELAIICENYFGSYSWDIQLTCRTYNFNMFSTAFEIFMDIAQATMS